MGGDFAPSCVVQGAFDALRERTGGFSVILVGHEDRIRAELAKAGGAAGHEGRFSVAHAPEVIDMDDAPTAALKSKKNSSIAVGLQMQREGRAEAFVSAGNTGAVICASTLILGRLARVGRPTIGALIPTAKGPSLLLDAGANVDCKPRHLFEFGVMGSIYAGAMLGMPTPAVGLLNIGEEDRKGMRPPARPTGCLPASTLYFKGNVEGRDVLKGDVHVIVCDGFMGNILLKFGESVPWFLQGPVRGARQRESGRNGIALLARGSLRGIMKELDYQEHGGVPVLGITGVSIIGHGRSTPKAIKNMIFRAQETAARGVHRRSRNPSPISGQGQNRRRARSPDHHFSRPRTSYMVKNRATISAVGHYVPEKVLSNADFEKMVDTSDEWIRTGPASANGACSRKEQARTWGQRRPRLRCDNRGITAEEVDLIICATVTPDMFFPSTACLIQEKIGAKNAWGFDLVGRLLRLHFCIDDGRTFMENGKLQEGRCWSGTDKMTSITDYTDRNNCILFGDAAGAVLVEASRGSERRDA